MRDNIYLVAEKLDVGPEPFAHGLVDLNCDLMQGAKKEQDPENRLNLILNVAFILIIDEYEAEIVDEAALAYFTFWEEALGVVQVCDDEKDKEGHECKLEDESLLL